MSSKTIAIIGGGLTGLTAAVHLKRNGYFPTVFEASSELGGMVKTDLVEGCLLDHGFQVFLDSYEEVKSFVNLEELKLRPAASGAMIYVNKKWIKFGNPLKNPAVFFPTLLAKVGNLWDKWLIFKLSFAAKDPFFRDKNKELTTMDFLKSYGFSDNSIQSFFVPFFGGVFLEYALNTSAWLFLYLFQKFSDGNACLPEAGMKSLVEKLEIQLPNESIQLNTPINDYEEQLLMDFEYVIDSRPLSGVSYNEIGCYYFKAKTNGLETKYLHLVPNGKMVKHVCFLNAIQPSYLYSDSEFLLSVTTDYQETSKMEEIKEELSEIFKDKLTDISFVKDYSMPKALPFFEGEQKGCYWENSKVLRTSTGLYYPSINAAFKAGREAAELIINKG